MKRSLLLSVAVCALAAPMFTPAALSADMPGTVGSAVDLGTTGSIGTVHSASATTSNAGAGARDLVGICEVPPDFFEGNCPPTVSAHFDALKAQGITGDRFNTALIDATVALGERLQRAEAEKDIPLCIDIAEGILQTAAYSNDPGQRDAIAQLAQASCCVRITNADYGQLLGASRLVPITGHRNDGDIQSGATVFRSASASFVADDVRAGDLLVITSGKQQGFYLIAAATAPDTLTLQQHAGVAFAGWNQSEAPLTFEIRRAELPEEDNICDPGAATAVTASITLASSPASDE